MRISKVKISNFRSYSDEVVIDLNDLTAFVGKNDVGKSTVLEALDFFFNEGKGVIKLDKDDINKKCSEAGNRDIRISVVFENLPTSIVIDETNTTSLGGIRLGFEAAGGECVFTSEWNEFSQKTYRENFGADHPLIGDIVPYDANLIPDHDVLLAGFPCQPFSIAGVSKKNALGRPHGFLDKTQGTLFFDVARIIDAKRPKAFLLENVKNLRSHDKGRTFDNIMDVLRNELGYKVQWRIIDGKHFVPQHRERILIVGFREDVEFDFGALELPDVDLGPKLKTILHPEDGSEWDADAGRYIDPDSGKVHDKYTLTPKLWQYLQDYAAKHRAAGNGFGFGLVTGNDTSRTLSARYYKDGSEVLVSRGARARPRRLTPRECARLMGFPDDFRIPVSDTQAYKQFGNSVVVPVMEAVAKHMRPFLLEMLEYEKLSVRKRKAG